MVWLLLTTACLLLLLVMGMGWLLLLTVVAQKSKYLTASGSLDGQGARALQKCDRGRAGYLTGQGL